MSEPLTALTEVEVASCPLGPGACIVGTAILDELETEQRQVFEVVAEQTTLGDEEITRDVPNVGDDQLANLGDDGVVRVGARVRPGDLLVGKVAPRAGAALSNEEKLLRAIFGEAAGEVVDRSLRVPPGVEGTVTVARREPPHKGEIGRALVEVSWTRPVEVGDVLVDDRGHHAVVAGIRDMQADLCWGDGTGPRRVAKVAIARDRLHARSIGPYSVVTQRPLVGKASFGAQRVPASVIATLVEAGNPWAAWEMLTLKSDSVSGRIWAYECIVRGEHPAPRRPRGDADGLVSFFEPMTSRLPESIQVAQRELRALGLATDLDAEPIRGAWLTTEQVRDGSHGRVTRPETVNYRTYLPEPDGLFCQRIFGPVKDYECACGRYRRMRDRGVVCEDCGVEVIQSRVRRERFGHVELPVPLPHPWRLGELAARLGCTEAEVRSRLTELEATGDEFLEAVPVLAPDLRPLVPLDGGRWATSDLNDLYRRLINRSNRLHRLLELNAPEPILRNEHVQLFEALEALLDNARTARPLRFERRVLRSLRDVAEGHLGPELLEKPADYSGVAHLVVDPDLHEGTCRMPASMAVELFKPFAYGLMEARGYVSTIKSAKTALQGGVDWAVQAVGDVAARWPVLLVSDAGLCARRVVPWDVPAIAVGPETARALAALEVAVHVPLTEPAVAAARAWGEGVWPLRAVKPAPSGWLTGIATGGDLRKGVMAAGAGAEDTVEDPLLRVALGRCPDDDLLVTPWLTDEIIGPPRDPLGAWADRAVSDLELSPELNEALAAAGIATVGALAATSDVDLLKGGLRRAHLKAVREVLGSLKTR